MFKKFAETPLTLWIALAVVVALCVIFAALVKTRRKWNARMLASGALCVARSREYIKEAWADKLRASWEEEEK